ncbi:fimbria/pilus outer membrane usher protein, partial [Salmonella enterica subsp. enterica serovar Typhimurium]|uniref:fimbria/pilus outer membrane usher protein n=1 Tax=Salmonella enterica TaxID=28901 RepID=UPI00262F871C
DYASAALGMGKDMGSIGAVSFDVTHARSHFDDGDNESGQSWRFLYSKRFDDYASAALGMGKDMGSIGAVSFDVTHARSHFDDG